MGPDFGKGVSLGLMGLQKAGRLGGETEAPADCLKGMWRGLAGTCSGPQFTKTRTHTWHNSKATGHIKCHIKVQDWPSSLGQGLRQHGWPRPHLQWRLRGRASSGQCRCARGLGRWPGLPPEGSDRVGQSWGSRLQVQGLLARVSAGTGPASACFLHPAPARLLGAWGHAASRSGVWGLPFPASFPEGGGTWASCAPGWEINPLLSPKLGSQWL